MLLVKEFSGAGAEMLRTMADDLKNQLGADNIASNAASCAFHAAHSRTPPDRVKAGIDCEWSSRGRQG